MFGLKGIKASALFYALMVSLVVGVFCSSFVFLRYAYLKESTILNAEISVLSNLKSASVLVAELGKDCPQGWINLFESGEDSVFIRSGTWGGYAFSFIKAKEYRCEEQLTTIYGSRIRLDERVALSIVSALDGITLCGNTKLLGTVRCPNARVKRGYIDGRNFVGTTLVHGIIEDSPKSNPVLTDDYNLFIENLNGTLNTDSVVTYDQGAAEYSQSFARSTLRVMIHQDSVHIDNLVLKGNVILEAAGVLVLGSGVVLDNAICVAKNITLEQNFNGRGQFFVGSSFHADSLVTLHYPSFIGCLGNREQNLDIEIGPKCNIEGGICASGDYGQKSVISIGNYSTVYGLVYSHDQVEVKGSVKGTVFSNNLLVRTNSGIYINSILDAEFDGKALRDDFCFPMILFENGLYSAYQE